MASRLHGGEDSRCRRGGPLIIPGHDGRLINIGSVIYDLDSI